MILEIHTNAIENSSVFQKDRAQKTQFHLKWKKINEKRRQANQTNNKKLLKQAVIETSSMIWWKLVTIRSDFKHLAGALGIAVIQKSSITQGKSLLHSGMILKNFF